MGVLDLGLLFILVVIGVFITGWITPFIIVIINRLLYVEFDPTMILILCMAGGAVGNFLLWLFDAQVHHFLDNKLKIEKHRKAIHTNKGIMRKISHSVREKVKYLNNKYLLFFGFVIASFSFIPDFVTVDFARSKEYKMPVFVLAMFIGKLVVYSPLIWGSIGFMELVKVLA